jgi:dethiobiotin synthetase
LTISDIRKRGLPVAGLVLNSSFSDDLSTASNRSLLEELTNLPVLFELNRGQENLEIELAWNPTSACAVT